MNSRHDISHWASIPSIIDSNDPQCPIRKQAIPSLLELRVGEYVKRFTK